MLTFDDFTSFPRGSEVLLAGRIEECPVCGRNGIESRDGERGCFVHSQATDVIGDGMRVEPIDLCLFEPSN